MAPNPNIKFRSFVCQGLNDRLLHEWIAILTRDEGTMAKFYETWAFVRASEVRAHGARASAPYAARCRWARVEPHRSLPHRRARLVHRCRVQSALGLVMSTIEPLRSLPFRLSLDYEITRWDL